MRKRTKKQNKYYYSIEILNRKTNRLNKYSTSEIYKVISDKLMIKRVSAYLSHYARGRITIDAVKNLLNKYFHNSDSPFLAVKDIICTRIDNGKRARNVRHSKEKNKDIIIEVSKSYLLELIQNSNGNIVIRFV